jgi:hypothetical protein
MKKATALLLVVVLSLTATAQMNDTEMQATYWKYRDQMKKYFMKIGTLAGESLL